LSINLLLDQPTLVDTVTKSDKYKHKIGHNTACNGDNITPCLKKSSTLHLAP